MDDTLHIAITRRVRPENAAEFERLLTEFAGRTLSVPGSRGVHLLFPPPGSESNEYGILRSFANSAARDAFYSSALYRDWTAQIDHLVESEPIFRKLDGLEAWFRGPLLPMPPRWKMAVLTWIAVWPVSIAVPAALAPFYGPSVPFVIRAGVGAAGIVLVLTWVAMPLLVKLAHRWLRGPSTRQL